MSLTESDALLESYRNGEVGGEVTGGWSSTRTSNMFLATILLDKDLEVWTEITSISVRH